jgi:hypothetical protein
VSFLERPSTNPATLIRVGGHLQLAPSPVSRCTEVKPCLQGNAPLRTLNRTKVQRTVAGHDR